MEPVLIIDDEQNIIDLLGLTLKVAGIQSTGALTAQAGLQLMEEKLFNIVLCDIRLPDIDGKELIGKLRDINPLCQIIMITAYTSMENVVACLGGGAIDYFTKPFDSKELILTLQQLNAKLARWKKATPITVYPGA